MTRYTKTTFEVLLFMQLACCIGNCFMLQDPYPEKGHFHKNDSVEQYLQEELDGTEVYETWGETDGPDVWRWNVEDYPNPQFQPRFCHRMAPSNVCDPDDVLQRKQADTLDELIRKIYNETSCICGSYCLPYSGGMKIGIALLKNYYRPYGEHPSKTIKAFSMNLRSKWNIGLCEDDILIVVSTNDRQSYTAVGLATEHYISSEEAYEIFLQHRAAFSGGRYYEGLKAMLEDYYDKLFAVVPNKAKSQKNLGEITGIAIGVVVALGITILLVVFLYKYWKRGEDTNNEKARSHSRASDTHSDSWRRSDIAKTKKKKKLNSPSAKSDEDDEPDNGRDGATTKLTSEEEVLNTDLAEPDPVSEVKVSLLPKQGGGSESENDEVTQDHRPVQVSRPEDVPKDEDQVQTLPPAQTSLASNIPKTENKTQDHEAKAQASNVPTIEGKPSRDLPRTKKDWSKWVLNLDQKRLDQAIEKARQKWRSDLQTVPFNTDRFRSPISSSTFDTFKIKGPSSAVLETDF